ncbi:MAG: 16S rRNA (adenine(1518)-N(6)/adenine(1519)-N(6))-dimethyltransferase RsmA [Ruminococcaceae bacterium]|nr:16S rRNA (adenine(1518)-N(6)/adenine(1519)-N(6))-dimethyltransferase RsmA [Oscillospiraceae bacterium]
MPQLTDIAYLRDLLSRHGFSFSKKLGQNFLINPSVCPRMAASCGSDKEGGALEIGPGVGVLTKELAAVAGQVVAVELDDRLLPVLDETLSECDNVTVVHGDALKLDLHALIRENFGDRRVSVCANLPYYITSPLIMALLESRLPIDSLTVMVQREAADRLCAAVGTRAAGAVTLAVAYYAEAEKLFDVSRGSFMPAPNVDSAVIRLTVRKTPPVAVKDEKMMFRLIRAGFGQRRKTVSNSLGSAVADRERLRAALETAGVSPTARAEELSLAQFAAIADAVIIE